MMDKNKAVHQLSELGCMSVSNAEDLYDSFFEKPVVPQCVADWYEEHKANFESDLWEYLVDWEQRKPNDFKEWIQKEGTQPIITLVSMHQFGYEVEKETKYRVRVKGVSEYSTLLNKSLNNQNWFFGTREQHGSFRSEHTRKELEENGFGWVFDCEGIEIEEVE